MTRSTLFDRLNQELEPFGRKAQAALDEGKLQIELMRVRRRRDSLARDLGLLVHRRERGSEVEPRRVEALLLAPRRSRGRAHAAGKQMAEARRQRRRARRAAVDRRGAEARPPATAGAHGRRHDVVAVQAGAAQTLAADPPRAASATRMRSG